ncbi:HET-domain-containing protein [Karstenula rhodostoma CBS 690.94]|uniref:HET-domain-containing protein n=1 Tax=Karstenula rhodostoma CBS 690.94 TaxID=1392251 RepID=A0A9P4PFU8_9PLEO|nr:HET-domain-containing protein [Karstenula rhodostoma CBS 690.94]
MVRNGLYEYHGTKEELAKWAHSNPGGCSTCCNLDYDSWFYGVPIRLAKLPKSRESCSFCDILFKVTQTPYFASFSKVGPIYWMCAFTPVESSRGDKSLPRLLVRLDAADLVIDDEDGLEDDELEGDQLGTGELESTEPKYTSFDTLEILFLQGEGTTTHYVFVPRRLLTVDTQKQSTTLVELDPGHAPVTYACLSHCWGSRQPLTTTTATRQQRKNGIDWHELPKTFQEALSLCSMLGLSYLWIDSLCIIQDDDDDWASEASKMAEVYSNSYLTIAASASRDDTEGCFRVSDCPAYGFQTTFGDESEVEFFVRKDIQHNYASFRKIHTISDGKWTMLGSWPFMQRAWAFQERLLLPRVLHLGPSEAVWECQKHTLCECSEKDSQFDSPHLIRKSNWFSGMSDPSQEAASQLWQKIVMEYTCRRLTFQKDVFPALSGIARQFQTFASFGGTREYPGTYLAGMWRSDLMQQLMWFNSNSNYLSKPVDARELPVPSWSWAASEGGGVAFYQQAFSSGDFIEETKILSCSCELLTPNLYGEVVAGHLQLQAQVLLLGLHRAAKSHEHYFTEHNHDGLSAKFASINIRLDFEYDFTGKYTHKLWESTYTTEDVYVANMGAGIADLVFFRRAALILKKSDSKEKIERITTANKFT